VLAHVREHAADELRHEVGLQRPGGVRVADGEREVRHAAEHHALVGEVLGQVHGHPVHGQLDAAERLQVEAGRGDDDVGFEVLARRELDAVGREALDPVGDHRRLPLAQHPEQVAVRHQAQALVPRTVRRLEVQVDVEPGGQPRDRALADQLAHQPREAL
jgi:hypothetical protein